MCVCKIIHLVSIFLLNRTELKNNLLKFDYSIPIIMKCIVVDIKIKI